MFASQVIRSVVALMCGVLLSVSLFTSGAMAEEVDSVLARGGKLYDKWYKVIGAKAPEQSHPAYPADGKYAKKPKSNWRCKECHGWDYRGKDGAYAKGKHFSGIKGINAMAGMAPAKITAALKDTTHGLAGKMGDGDFQALALFVSAGQLNMDPYIDRASKMPKGDKAKGAAYFNTICAGCHGRDGFKPKDMKKTLGKQMGNPWEVMHKILNGQPGESMPALRALDRQITADIMAHMTTLPSER
ncbi:MAG: cytochrome c [Alphaproteobacteria bacterium]|nr:cytochrome c [Alphaproteobacteria bacterium]MDP6567480.1 cytochrome c [Alphaproteobacteria bacterium]MDP6815330.1 cytochrome c [Alphaproteobacteria bacterium]